MSSLRFFSILILLLFVSITTSCGTRKFLEDRPDVSSFSKDIPTTHKENDSLFVAGSNFLSKNNLGLWELYVSGDAYERGLLIGSLSDSLMARQETIFMERINDLVPSENKQNFLKKFLAWYNRKMHQHIPLEIKKEIYGISQYVQNDYNDLAPPYLRLLYLHSSHDIAHALQDLALVGCTSFAVWDEKSEDGNLLIGRNFDFYAGDEFAKDKVVSFVRPNRGHNFISIGWAGMVGVVSGMNDQGLTVTINAGKSKIPLQAKTPITIVTRDILQNAANLQEAITIAKKHEVFVSESIMVGSAKDNQAIIIEVSPKNFGVYDVPNQSELICSNHFQSEAYKTDRRNAKTISESHTAYRFERMTELLQERATIDPEAAVKILRDQNGLEDISLGMGNEKAINQLLAHHGVVFQPKELKVWVSSNPYQLGEFVAYDLNQIFKDSITGYFQLSNPKQNIVRDPFLSSQAYEDYEKYRELATKIESKSNLESSVDLVNIREMVDLNPQYWKPYFLLGKFYYDQKKYKEADAHFRMAMEKEVTTLLDEQMLNRWIIKTKRKLK